MTFCFGDYEHSAEALRRKNRLFIPQVALILGSGLGNWGNAGGRAHLCPL